MTVVLVVEADEEQADAVHRVLIADGLMAIDVGDAAEATAVLRDAAVDLLIVSVDDAAAVELIGELRGRGEHMPIVALAGVRDARTVEALERGADDFVTKPVEPGELSARVRIALEVRGRARTPLGTAEASPLLVSEGLSLDLHSRRVRVAGKQVKLTSREFTLLETLIRHRGQVLSREQLLSLAWGYDFDPGSNVVDVYIGYLRRKVGPGVIETVRGMGYRFGGNGTAVRVVEDSGVANSDS